MITTEPLQETMDRASFELLSQNNPRLIEQIKAALTAGASANEIERRLLSRFDPGNLTVSLAVCAAYYLERNPQEETNEPSNPTNNN